MCVATCMLVAGVGGWCVFWGVLIKKKEPGCRCKKKPLLMLKTHPCFCCSSHRDSSFEECRMTWLEKPPNRYFSSMIFQFF